MQADRIWLGMTHVLPRPGSEHEHEGRIGGYGLVVFTAADLREGVSLLWDELQENGSTLIGFEWLSRLDHYEEKLSDYASGLLDRLETYPIQFQEFDWYLSESGLEH